MILDTLMLDKAQKAGAATHKPRKQSSLKDSEQETDDGYGGVAVDTAEANSESAPSEHEEGNPPRRPEFLQEDVGRDLEQAVRHQEAVKY